LKIGTATAGESCFFSWISTLRRRNDSFGHGEGDLALKRVAKALAEMTFAFRRNRAGGGDESTVLGDRGRHPNRESAKGQDCEGFDGVSPEKRALR